MRWTKLTFLVEFCRNLLSVVSGSLGTTELAMKTCWALRWKRAGLGILNRTYFPISSFSFFFFFFFFKRKESLPGNIFLLTMTRTVSAILRMKPKGSSFPQSLPFPFLKRKESQPTYLYWSPWTVSTILGMKPKRYVTQASLKEFVIWLRLVFSNTIPSFEPLRKHL